MQSQGRIYKLVGFIVCGLGFLIVVSAELVPQRFVGAEGGDTIREIGMVAALGGFASLLFYLYLNRKPADTRLTRTEHDGRLWLSPISPSRVVCIPPSAYPDEVLERLPAWKRRSVCVLSAAGCNLSVSFFFSLKSLPQLMILDLQNAQFDYAAVEALEELGRLDTVLLSSTITAEQLKIVKNALPGVSIEARPLRLGFMDQRLDIQSIPGVLDRLQNRIQAAHQNLGNRVLVSVVAAGEGSPASPEAQPSTDR